MSFYSQNQTLLARRFPEVLTRMDASVHTTRAFSLREGGLMLDVAGNEVAPYGTGGASRLVQAWANALSLEPRTCYFLSGFGLGLQVRAVLERLPQDSVLFVWEENAALLKAVFNQENFNDFLADERLLLGVGNPDADCFQSLDSLHYDTLAQVQPLIYGPLFAVNALGANLAFKAFKEQYLFVNSNYTGCLKDGLMLQEATLHNANTFLRAPDVGCMRDLFHGLPLILVGAGPSLDEALPFLKRVEARGIIACVNSAYRSLRDAGIHPQITVAVDARPDTFKGYAGSLTEGTYLVAPYTVNPEVPKVFPGRIFTWTGQSALAKTLRVRLGLGEGMHILEQGTVSASILDLARLWGCSRVCLVGQDMALGPFGKTHASNSFYADEGRLYEPVSQGMTVPGNEGTPVLTDAQLFVYLKTFEHCVQDFSGIDFINTARTGAAIRGVPYHTYEEAEDWLGDSDASYVRTQLRKLVDEYRGPGFDEITKALGATRQFAERVFQASTEAAVHCACLPERLSAKSYEKHALLLACDQYADTVNRLLDRYPRDYEVLFEGKTRAELARYQSELKHSAQDDSAWTRAQQNKAFFWAIAEGSDALLGLFSSNASKAFA
ncbi:MAG TPA: hypothetical protein DIU37_05230 [Opitutae bacterium]|nr:hypothetical protein [Opitutae bacterium]|tara:strand:+ start:5087 stop:6913 length:1827 start_codon:yes stop_codon:yes gene_type:complete